jgi:hypothetical protein
VHSRPEVRNEPIGGDEIFERPTEAPSRSNLDDCESAIDSRNDAAVTQVVAAYIHDTLHPREAIAEDDVAFLGCHGGPSLRDPTTAESCDGSVDVCCVHPAATSGVVHQVFGVQAHADNGKDFDRPAEWVGLPWAVLPIDRRNRPVTTGMQRGDKVVTSRGNAAFMASISRSPASTQLSLETSRQSSQVDEHELRARWLHDVVLSEVRLALLRLDERGSSVEAARRELVDLDHRLRVGQLSETMLSGGATIGEIVQVYVRRMQGLGVSLAHVTHGAINTVHLESSDALNLQHALSVLTSNSVNAGASMVGIGLTQKGSFVTVEIVDDAGGFDLGNIASGRALSNLTSRAEYRCLRHRPVPRGSAVAVDVLISPACADATGGR